MHHTIGIDDLIRCREANGDAGAKASKIKRNYGLWRTIRLDSGEVVYVSIAQVGVLVRHWDMSGGVESLLFGIAGGSMLCNFSQAGRSVACPTPRYKA